VAAPAKPALVAVVALPALPAFVAVPAVPADVAVVAAPAKPALVAVPAVPAETEVPADPAVVADVAVPVKLPTNPPLAYAWPAICNLYDGFVMPIPTLPENSASPTVPSACTLNDGIPDISLIENIYPEDKLLFTENSCPDDPSNDNVLSSSTYNEIGAFVDPVNAILGREVVSLFGVIRIFLSELAIFTLF
jgi:hypothetical protein